MRSGFREATGLLFVEVFGERMPHVRQRRDLPERPREQHRKVTNEDDVFVTEVSEKLLAGKPGLGQRRIRPMMLLVHDREEPRGERMTVDRFHDEIVTGHTAFVTFSGGR